MNGYIDLDGVGDRKPSSAELTAVAAGLSAGGAALDQGVYNLKRSNMKNWIAARANVVTGTARAKVACVGTSIVAGVGSGIGGANTTIGARPRSWPSYLAGALRAKDARLNPTLTNRTGTNFISQAGYDSRLTQGAGWSNSAAAPGGTLFANSSTANPWALTIDTPVDTVDAYYARNTGLGSFSIDIGGAALATIPQSGAAALLKSTIALGALAPVTINAKRVSGSVFFLGVDAYNSAVPDLAIWNMGASGYKMDQLAGDLLAYYPLPGVIAMGPSLLILDAGTNDWDQDTDPVAFAASTVKLISTVKATGTIDVIVVIPIPSAVASATEATQRAYADIIKAAALAYDCPVLDMLERWTSYVAAPPGFYTDNLHPSGLGSMDEAEAIAVMLTKV